MTTLADFPDDARRVYQVAAFYCADRGRSVITQRELRLIASPDTLTWLRRRRWIQPVTVPDPFRPGHQVRAYRVKHPKLDHLPCTLEIQE